MILLVVSGNQEIAKAFQDLETLGYSLSSCTSVLAATALVEELNPRVVIIDLNVKGAKDFVRWLKKETGTINISVNDADATEASLLSGIDGSLITPIDVETVTELFASLGIKVTGNKDKRDEETEFWDITRDIKGVFEEDEEEPLGQVMHSGSSTRGDIRVISQEVVAIWGAKGGVGRTTLSILMCHLLSEFDVLLVDLNFKEGPGDVNVLLDLPATPHLGRLLEEKGDRRKGFLGSLIKPKNGSFAVIQPPPTIDQAEQICPDDIIELIDQARRCFQIVIIDLPSDISPVTLEAVDLSTSMLFVSDGNLGSLARIESIKSFVRKDIAKALLLNGFNAGTRKAREIAHILDMPLVAAIPEYQTRRNEKISDDLIKDCDNIVTAGVKDVIEAVFGIEKCAKTSRNGLNQLIKSVISNVIG